MQAIVAVSENWGIGKDGQLLFHIGADLKRFKELTLGHTVVMGRKTLESLPGGRGLPGRRNIVLSGQADYAAEGAEVVHTPSELVFTAGADAFVIGGETVYRRLLPLCERVYVTRVFAGAEADAFFPDLSADPRWQVEHESEVMEEKGLRFQYVEYVPAEEDEEDFLPVSAEPTPFAATEGFDPFVGFQ